MIDWDFSLVTFFSFAAKCFRSDTKLTLSDERYATATTFKTLNIHSFKWTKDHLIIAGFILKERSRRFILLGKK